MVLNLDGLDDGYYLTSRSKMQSPHLSRTTQRRAVQILYILALISWIAAYSVSTGARGDIEKLESKKEAVEREIEEYLSEYKLVKKESDAQKERLRKAERTHQALTHEVRMLTELSETADYHLSPSPDHDELISTWLAHRQVGLQQRAKQLQAYVQEYSRQMVLEQYGKGPHLVKFTVEMDNVESDFTVELAPVDDMPHTVHYFLDMVHMKLLDSTLFLHHESVEHVIAGLPIDFESQNPKHHHLAYMGWTTLGFPEYNEKWPHAHYTIGIAKTGPTFYINTMDNSEHHGPGGQAHHNEGEADPCFGRVVEGKETVDALVQYGLYAESVEVGEEHPWASQEHSWTKIVKVELVKS